MQTRDEQLETHSCPLLPGWLVSLSQPVYAMVTFWPREGWLPLPATWVVLVTPIAYAVYREIATRMVVGGPLRRLSRLLLLP